MLEYGELVQGLIASSDDGLWVGKLPPLLRPRRFVCGRVKGLFPAAPDVADISDERGRVLRIVGAHRCGPVQPRETTDV